MDSIRPWLYIGKYRDTLNHPLLMAHNIQAMLQLADPVEQPGINSLFLPVEDFAIIPDKLISQGVKFVQSYKHQPVLIACGAGINRSTAFAIAVLKEEDGLNLFDCFLEVKRRHPEAMPHQPIWESLCNYYNEIVPWEELLHT